MLEMRDLEKLKDERGYLPFPLSDWEGHLCYPIVERTKYDDCILQVRMPAPRENGIATLTVISTCGKPTDTWNETVMAIINGFNKEDK